MVELMKRNYSESKAGKLFGLDHSTANHAKKVVRIVNETKYPQWMYNNMRVFRLNTDLLPQIIDEKNYVNFEPFIYESLTT